MNKLLLIISCAIGMPILVVMIIAFFTGGGFRISIKNNDTDVTKAIKYNIEDEITQEDIELLEKCKEYFIQDQGYVIATELELLIKKLNELI